MHLCSSVAERIPVTRSDEGPAEEDDQSVVKEPPCWGVDCNGSLKAPVKRSARRPGREGVPLCRAFFFCFFTARFESVVFREGQPISGCEGEKNDEKD